MKKKAWIFILVTVIGAVLGFTLGVLDGLDIFSITETMEGFSFVAFIISVVFVLILSIALHEVGHMLGGLASGYKFVSLSILGLTFVNGPSGITFINNLSLNSVIGGRCAMEPPELKDGRYPYFLFYYGSIIMNIILSILGILFIILQPFKFSLEIGVSLILINVILVLTNGIPQKNAALYNDASQIKAIRESKESYYGAYYGLRINGQYIAGIPLVQLSKQYLMDIEKHTPDNYYIADLYAMKAQALLFENKIDEAYQLLQKHEKTFMTLPALLKVVILCELSYIRLLYGYEGTLYFDSENCESFLTATERFRILYAKNLLIDHDSKKAASVLKQWQKHLNDKNTPQDSIDYDTQQISLIQEHAKALD